MNETQGQTNPPTPVNTTPIQQNPYDLVDNGVAVPSTPVAGGQVPVPNTSTVTNQDSPVDKIIKGIINFIAKLSGNANPMTGKGGKPVVQQPIQQPVQQPMQQPVQQPMQQPVQQPMQQPVQQPMQQPVQQPMQQPVQQPMQQPVQQPMQQPVQQPMQESVQQPMQEPVQQPMQEPVQEINNNPTPVKNTTPEVIEEAPVEVPQSNNEEIIPTVVEEKVENTTVVESPVQENSTPSEERKPETTPVNNGL